MTTVTLDDTVVQNSSILAARAGAEVLAMSEQSGNCFSIAGSGTFIWEAAAQPIRVRDICTRLRRRYKVDEETCSTQTLAYVATLIAEGLLLVAPPEA